MLAFGIAMKCGWQPHCNRAKKALGRRSRRHNVAPSSPPPTVVPMAENHGLHVANNDPIYGKLDGCPAPTPPEEAPHQTTATATSYEDPVFSQLDGYPEAPPPRTRPPPATPAPVDSTLATPSAPPPYPRQSQNSESWKEGTVTEANAESWK